MADRASSKRKFGVSNAPSNKRKKTSPNLFCGKERTCTLCDRNKIENLLLVDCTRSYMQQSGLFFSKIESKIPSTHKIFHEILVSEVMHLSKSFIQDLDTSLSALPDNIELILLGDFNVNFTGSNLNIDKVMKRKLIQVTNSHELDQLINNTAFLSVAVIFV